MPAKKHDAAEVLRLVLSSPNVADSNGEVANVVDVIHDLAQAVRVGLKYLGNGDAGTTMGAVEAHGVMLRESSDRVAGALESVASAVGDVAAALTDIALAIEGKKRRQSQ